MLIWVSFNAVHYVRWVGGTSARWRLQLTGDFSGLVLSGESLVNFLLEAFLFNPKSP